MRKIVLEDILDLTAYERQRKDFRPKIMSIKNQRRLQVGSKVTYLFETYDTMWYQVQEMTRAERIVDEDGIMAEINAYNELIPDRNQLSATMFIEIDDIVERKGFLTKIVDLPNHTYLKVNNDKIAPSFDPRQGSEDKLSSVQYLKFTLLPEQAEKFNAAETKVIFGFDHPEYNENYELSAEQKDVLFNDMNDTQ